MDFESEHPESVVHCENAKEFLEQINMYGGVWGDDPRHWIFRGHGDSTWKLLPSILRPTTILHPYSAVNPLKPRPNPRNEDQAYFYAMFEWDIVYDFMELTDWAQIPLPDDSPVFRTQGFKNDVVEKAIQHAIKGEYTWPPDDLLSIFALAQHYGVPTRLLDWSRYPLIAAHFAAVDSLKPRAERLAVWGLDRNALFQLSQLSKGMMAKAIQIVESTPVKNIEILNKKLKLMSTQNVYRVGLVHIRAGTNPNLGAQKGIFTVDRNILVDTQLEELLVQNEWNWDTSNPPLKKVTLLTSVAGKLLRLLSYPQITSAELLPGLSGVVKALEESRSWDKPRS